MTVFVLNQDLNDLNRCSGGGLERADMTRNFSLMHGQKARSAVFAPEDPRIQSQACWIPGSRPAMRD
jgi:hypothetical protein